MTPSDLRTLLDYHYWARDRVLDAAALLTPEQFTKDLGSSFTSVRDTLAHIMFGQWIWLERWQGRMPTKLPSAEDFTDLASLRKRWAEIETNLQTFVRGLTPEQIAAVSEYKTQTAGTLKSPLGHMLQHLVNHGTYHRGQVTTMLRQLGAKSLSTDMSLFYRERGAAAAR